MDEPKLLPVIGPLIRSATASIEDGAVDPSPQTATGLRSWRSTREQLSQPALHTPGGADEPSRVTVPTNVAVVLQATLGGQPPTRCARCTHALRCIPRIWRVRIWCSCWLLIGASSGYFALIFKDGTFLPSPQYWGIVGNVAVFVYTVVGLTCGIATYEMAEIVGAMVDEDSPQQRASNLDADLLSEARERPNDANQVHSSLPFQEQEAGSVRRLRENPSRLFLRGLLQCEVSKAASQVLAQQMKRSAYQVLFVSLIVVLMAIWNVTRPGRREHIDGTDTVHRGVLCSLVVFGLTLCPCAVIITGWLVFLKAPCVVICDRVKFSAARVRQMTSDTADYDAIMGYIQEAHELTVRLGVLLSPPLLGTCIISTLISFQWLFAASICLYCESNHLDGWVDQATEKHLIAHIPVPAWFACAFVVIQCPVWPLFAAASATTACDELVEAVAALRNARQPLPPLANAASEFGYQNSHQNLAIKMASPSNLIRITGLLHFAKDVNRTAGLGVLLQPLGPLCGRRLITVRFVWHMVAYVAGGMSVLLFGVYVALASLRPDR